MYRDAPKVSNQALNSQMGNWTTGLNIKTSFYPHFEEGGHILVDMLVCRSMCMYVSMPAYPRIVARRGGAEVAGWTLDRKIRVRFPAYPHCVWALWWQGGKRRLRTSRCPCRGRLGTLKTPSCPWRKCQAAGQNPHEDAGILSREYVLRIPSVS